MRKVIRIDANGFFVEDVLLEDYEETPEDCVEIEVPEGFFRPKWDGSQWVEGLTQEEIDAIRSAPSPETPDEKIARLEAELAAARETNLTALEAIAELYEMMLAQGGGTT